MALPTLLDIVKRNGRDGLVGLFDEASKNVPEMRVVPSRPINGVKYSTLVRTALGRTTGSFRSVNAGTTSIVHQYENREFATYTIEPRFECDKAQADRSEDGAAAYIAEQASGILEGEMQGLAKAFYYGTNATFGNADAYPGLLQSYDATNMVVDAGGTTDNTASSMWLVRVDIKGVWWIWGANGSFSPSPVRVESLIDPNDSTKKFDGYVQTLTAYPGLQVLSTQAACRIKKLTADSGKGLTDTLVSQALAKFPAGRGPTHAFLTMRSMAQLQAARTATSPTGAPAPFPTSITGVDGQLIPLLVTEAISNIETLAL